jgi:hypothetical protein
LIEQALTDGVEQRWDDVIDSQRLEGKTENAVDWIICEESGDRGRLAENRSRDNQLISTNVPELKMGRS